MFQRAISALISIVLLLIFCGSSLIVLKYNLNKAEIIEKYCVNKDKPEMCCEGKCHLEKQLKQQAEKEEQSPFSTVKENFELIGFIQKQTVEITLYGKIIKVSFPHINWVISNFKVSVFRPPGLVN